MTSTIETNGQTDLKMIVCEWAPDEVDLLRGDRAAVFSDGEQYFVSFSYAASHSPQLIRFDRKLDAVRLFNKVTSQWGNRD